MTTTRNATEIIADAGLTIEFQHVPTNYDPKSKEWQHIAWNATLTTPRGSFQTPYKQGIGHIPKEWGIDARSLAGSEALNRILRTGRRHIIGPSGDALKTAGVLPTPEPLDLLSSLCSDAGAIDETFDNWCANYGYDSDSRKAEATYNACREIGLNMIRIMGAALFEELRNCDDITQR